MVKSKASKINRVTLPESAQRIVGLAITFLLILPIGMSFFNYAHTILSYPYVWALTENENMLFIHAILTGTQPYNVENQSQFFYYIYPPIYHIVSSIFSFVSGYTIFIPRMISIISLLGLAAILCLFFTKKWKSLENLFVTGILVMISLGYTAYSSYYVFARTDMLALFIAFISIYSMWKVVYGGQNNSIYYWAIGMTSIFALFTKQSIVFPFIVILLLSLFAENRARWLRLALYIGISTIASTLILNAITKGGFLQSMIIAREIYGKYLNEFSHLTWLQKIFIDQLWPLGIGFFILIALSAYSIYRKRLPSFSVLVFLSMYINFLLTGGNRGAEFNTMIPLLFGLLLVMKDVYFYDSVKISRYIFYAVFIVLCLVQISMFEKVADPYLMPTYQDKKNHALLIQTIENSNSSLILGDRVDYAIALAGKKSLLEASTHNVAREWKKTKPYADSVESSLLNKMKNKEVDIVVLTITDFGKGSLYTFTTSNGKLIRTLNIRYFDAPGIDHDIYGL